MRTLGLKLVIVSVLITVLFFAPAQRANATWINLLWETFDYPWLEWPWQINGHPWVVLPTSGYQWGIVHEIYHYPFNDQSIWCAGMLNYNITPLTPFIDDYPPNMHTLAIWGPFSLANAVEAECNFWYWSDTENYSDYLAWGASTSPNGNPFYENDRISGINSSGDWDNAILDFADLETAGGDSISLIGYNNVYVVFLFHSNGSISSWGSFLDDISVGWNDGLFDLIAVLPQFLDADSNVVVMPVEGEQYYLRLRWEIEGEGTTGPFLIQCDVDDEEFFSQEVNYTVTQDTIIYTYADQMWGGSIGPHTLEWTLDVNNQVVETYENNNSVDVDFEVIMFDSLPWIEITRPTEGDTADTEFWIKWEDYDRESDATIFLYYDPDSVGFNGSIINTTPIYEDSDPDSFNWDTSNLPDGNSYYVYAIINDGYNPAQFDYSDYPVYINHPTHVKGGGIAPNNYEVTQNYPNPFNSSTSITFVVSENSRVEMSVFDVNGRLMEVLTNRNYEPGSHNITWNPDAGSGVYFCEVKIVGLNSQNLFESTIKMLYIR